jgi:hypothetical protein
VRVNLTDPSTVTAHRGPAVGPLVQRGAHIVLPEVRRGSEAGRHREVAIATFQAGLRVAGHVVSTGAAIATETIGTGQGKHRAGGETEAVAGLGAPSGAVRHLDAALRLLDAHLLVIARHEGMTHVIERDHHLHVAIMTLGIQDGDRVPRSTEIVWAETALR